MKNSKKFYYELKEIQLIMISAVKKTVYPGSKIKFK